VQLLSPCSAHIGISWAADGLAKINKIPGSMRGEIKRRCSGGGCGSCCGIWTAFLNFTLGHCEEVSTIAMIKPLSHSLLPMLHLRLPPLLRGVERFRQHREAVVADHLCGHQDALHAAHRLRN
jgi:hypothetical protein